MENLNTAVFLSLKTLVHEALHSKYFSRSQLFSDDSRSNFLEMKHRISSNRSRPEYRPPPIRSRRIKPENFILLYFLKYTLQNGYLKTYKPRPVFEEIR